MPHVFFIFNSAFHSCIYISFNLSFIASLSNVPVIRYLFNCHNNGRQGDMPCWPGNLEMPCDCLHSSELIGLPRWVDCNTVLPWWLHDSQCSKRHGLQFTGIILLWLVGLNIDWDCLVPLCIMGSRDQWEFPPFQTPVTVPLRSPNGRQMPAVRAVQGDCERVYTLAGRLVYALLECGYMGVLFAAQIITWIKWACPSAGGFDISRHE